MKEKNSNAITGYFNALLEKAIGNRFDEPEERIPAEEISRIRAVILRDPRISVYHLLRTQAEGMLGLDEVEDVFPRQIESIVYQFIGTRLLRGKTMAEAVHNFCEAEVDTPAMFPKMLAEFGTAWLMKKSRWKTKKFKKLEVYMKRNNIK